MIKWFAYIVLLLIFAPYLSSAKIDKRRYALVTERVWQPVIFIQKQQDTTAKKRQQEEEEKKKIKEISKAKRQSKPEKIGDTGVKPKRERRPEGMERPPEIPRRNSN